MGIEVFYNPLMNCETGGFSPSGSKPGQVTEDWQRHNLACDYIHDFAAAQDSDLEFAHSKTYVQDIFTGELDNGHGNTSPAVATACRWTVGSMCAASRRALKVGVACSPSSGFHHAGWKANHGFCTFNGLMVAAQKLLDDGSVERVGILDFDFHYGDGTDDIISALELSEHVANVARKGRELLEHREIERLIDEMECDIVLYQAGADQHKDDPLGGLFTTVELRERDRLVFEHCCRTEIPIVWCLAGGYQKTPNGSIAPVLEIHRNTMLECAKAFTRAVMNGPVEC